MKLRRLFSVTSKLFTGDVLKEYVDKCVTPQALQTNKVLRKNGCTVFAKDIELVAAHLEDV